MDAIKDFFEKCAYEVEKVTDSLPLFWDSLERFLRQLKTAPMTMWNGTAGEPGNRLMLIVFLIGFAGGALYLIISFFRSGWREKLKMLWYAALAILILLVILYFALM